MTEHQTALMGRDAQQVLDNAAFKLAMETLKESVVKQWRECPVRDAEGQLLLLQLAKVTEKFEGLLVGLVETGKMAQHKIDMDSARNESAARKFLRKVG